MKNNGVSSKQSIRECVKSQRKKLDIKIISSKLVKMVQQTDEYIQARNVMIFYPKEYEVNLLSLLDDHTKRFYLPKIEGDNLLCCPFNSNSELCESCFKTLEPMTEPVKKSILDLVIVPALAVDKNNYRLGYGGGYYDRFLQGLNCNKIACIPKELVVDTIYPDAFDIKIDKIITA